MSVKQIKVEIEKNIVSRGFNEIVKFTLISNRAIDTYEDILWLGRSREM